MFHVQRLACGALLACCFAVAAMGQAETATISGQVTDASGAVVPGAEVVLLSVDRGTATTVMSNNAGIYVFPNVQPGQYRITVQKTGFRQVDLLGVLVNVQAHIEQNFRLAVGSTSESVTVNAPELYVNTTDGSVGTVIDRQFVSNIPLNGRSFQSLIDLAPGVTVTASSYSNQGQFSVNGQRTDANYFTVDGVSANASVGAGGAINSAGGGALPLSAAGGGYNNLVSLDDLQEFQIQTSTFAPEYGRSPGAQISLLTRSGTNSFHGDVFDYLRNNALDANNWFANAAGLVQPELRQNDFGGVLGGPVVKNKLFFFGSYEGLRETFAVPSFMGVPSLCARANAVSASQAPNATALLKQWLSAYPLPNGPDIPEVFGLTCHDLNSNLPTSMKLFSQFNANLPTTSTLDATSLRIDYHPSEKLIFFTRYNYAPSSSSVRSGADVTKTRIGAQTLTVGQTYAFSPTATNDLRFNYSIANPLGTFAMTNFAGAVPVPNSVIFPTPYTASSGQFLFNPGSGGSTVESLDAGTAINNKQQQFNVVDSFSLTRGRHELKFGLDWRQLTPRYSAPPFQIVNNFGAPEAMPFGGFFPGGLTVAVNSPHAEELRYQNYSAYAQDTWHVISSLTVTYGLRWEIDPAPSSPNGTPLIAINQFTPDDLSAIRALPLGSSPYATTWHNIAPRVGAAYVLESDPSWGRVIRGGFGIFYDTASDATSFTNGPYFPQNLFFNTNFPLPATAPAGQPALLPLPVLNTNPPYTRGINVTDPRLKLPYVYEFNAAFQQALGKSQSLTATYVGAIGRNLIRVDNYPHPSVDFTNQLSPYVNTGSSGYHALQMQFQRRLSHRLQGYASYTWSHSIDNGSFFNYSGIPTAFAPLSSDRGNSDFDIRHQFNVAVTYDIPTVSQERFLSAIVGHWSLDGIDHFRTALPINLMERSFNYTDATGLTYSVTRRPNVIPGQPLYVNGAQCAAVYGTGTANGITGNGALGAGQACPGGQGLNPAAFVAQPVPAAGAGFTQGDLPRNMLRGFGLEQLDLTLRRDFPIRESYHLEFRADIFNILNHPNFGPPTNFQVSNTVPLTGNFRSVNQGFGISRELLSNALGTGNATNGGAGGFSPLYNVGGQRSIQLSLKFRF